MDGFSKHSDTKINQGEKTAKMHILLLRRGLRSKRNIFIAKFRLIQTHHIWIKNLFRHCFSQLLLMENGGTNYISVIALSMSLSVLVGAGKQYKYPLPLQAC